MQSKSLYIAEKPSVAKEFAKVLNVGGRASDGYLESADAVVTWCVGHLVTMSYPEVYDPKLKKWSLDTLPFLPEEFKYELIDDVKKQFRIVERLLNREDVTCIYVCTDSGREGEYIYRLVDQMAHVGDKDKRRVWIDSQTEEEILRGIREAKPLSEYDHLADAAYLRAKEDYLMGINFSRLLTLKYGQSMSNYLGTKYTVISVGRVMTCVLGMVVRREREIRYFVKTPFYRVLAAADILGREVEAEWRVTEESVAWQKPVLYKENGFKTKEDAQKLITYIERVQPMEAEVTAIERKTEKKNPPLLYNLAELQNDCSRMFKISPDETLKIVQELYEKKLVTYPRTDARVLSTAVAKEIDRNISVQSLAFQEFIDLPAYAVGTDDDHAFFQGFQFLLRIDDLYALLFQIPHHLFIVDDGTVGIDRLLPRRYLIIYLLDCPLHAKAEASRLRNCDFHVPARYSSYSSSSWINKSPLSPS